MRRICLFSLLIGLFAPTMVQAQPRFATQRQGVTPPSAGLFVGINEFTEDNTIQDLNYAVNDAIDLAHLFVFDLRMVSPDNARLMLSGHPDPDDASRLAKLQQLEDVGIVPVDATKAKILKSLREVVDVTKTTQPTPDTLRSDFLVISISSHGFQESNGRNYIIPQDGLLSDLVGMGIDLKASIESKVSDAGASKKLILIDACRNEVEAEDSRRAVTGESTGRVVTEAFVQAFEQAKGLMVFYSGSPEQVSYEDHTLQQGVFTHYLLDALGRESPLSGNSNGIITLGHVVEHVRDEVQQWAISNQKPTVQVPFAGAGSAFNIPIAQFHQNGILNLHEQWGGTHIYIDSLLVHVIEGDTEEDTTLFSMPLSPGPHHLRLHLPPVIVENETPTVLDTLRYIDHEEIIDIPPGRILDTGGDPFSNFGFLNLTVSAPDEPPDAEVFITPGLNPARSVVIGEAGGHNPDPELPAQFLDDESLAGLRPGEIPLGRAPIFRALPAGHYDVRIDGGPKYAPLIEPIEIPMDEEVWAMSRLLKIVAPPRQPTVDVTFTGATITQVVRADSFSFNILYNLEGLPESSADLYKVELTYITGSQPARVAEGASGQLGLQRVGDHKTITWAILNDVPNAHARNVTMSLTAKPVIGFWKRPRNISFVAAGAIGLAGIAYLIFRDGSTELGLAGLPGLPPR